MADQNHDPDRGQQGKNMSGQAQNGPGEVGKPSPERPHEMKGPEADQVRAMNPGPNAPGFRGPGGNATRDQGHRSNSSANAQDYAKMKKAEIANKEKVRDGHRGDLSQEFQKEAKPRER